MLAQAFDNPAQVLTFSPVSFHAWEACPLTRIMHQAITGKLPDRVFHGWVCYLELAILRERTQGEG